MEVTEIGSASENGQVCVSLDVESFWTTTVNEIKSYSEQQATLLPDISKILLQQQSLN